MKYKFLFFLLLFALIFSSWRNYNSGNQYNRLLQKGKEALSFCKSNKYNTDFCILIDMSLPSGKNRAFLWDFKNDSILTSALCAHGCGSNPWQSTDTKEKPVFSNTPDSHCTSLGKYKVGKRGCSIYGIKVNYLLYGLENTNSNAIKREIVFHSWEEVSEKEVYPIGTPEGWGCPAVANSFMKTVDPKLRNSAAPVLLWIFK
ncbi:MAG: hypothetical protein A3F72_00345 [Bacteroidetes bacterium RIFCSPLOWO2_12_FULL_35_15]|nr:MAG: hypothetical protein A3F72_00345 [Bacteroidetes bacterium RIFCSPLOWO2_12_FULL_35_15]